MFFSWEARIQKPHGVVQVSDSNPVRVSGIDLWKGISCHISIVIAWVIVLFFWLQLTLGSTPCMPYLRERRQLHAAIRQGSSEWALQVIHCYTVRFVSAGLPIRVNHPNTIQYHPIPTTIPITILNNSITPRKNIFHVLRRLDIDKASAFPLGSRGRLPWQQQRIEHMNPPMHSWYASWELMECIDLTT